MAGKSAPNEATLSKLATGALQDDALRKRTQSVFDQALRQAEGMLRMGSDTQKSAIVKAIVPQLMRALQDEAAEEELAAQHAAYERLRVALRGDHKPAPPKKRAARKKAAPK